MMKTCLSLAFLCLLGLPLNVGAQQIIVLRNGDRLSGRLDGVADGRWVVRYGGSTLSIPVSQVATLSSVEPLGVRLSDGTIAAATIAGLAADSLLLTLAGGTTRRIAPADLAAAGRADDLAALELVAIGLFSPFARFWRATGSVGFSSKSGNSRARGFATSLELERKTRRDRLTINLGLNREESQPPGGVYETTVAKYYGAVRADIYVNHEVFLFAQTRQERDRFQDLSLRSTYAGGLGWQLANTDATDINISLSAGMRREAFIGGGSEVVAVAAVGQAMTHKLGPATFAWRADWTPNVADLGDYRLRSDASITTSIYRGIGLRLGLVNEYNNRPRPGVEAHDMLITTTVTYAVGR